MAHAPPLSQVAMKLPVLWLTWWKGQKNAAGGIHSSGPGALGGISLAAGAMRRTSARDPGVEPARV